MPASTARIETTRANRYQTQLVEHLSHLSQGMHHHGRGGDHGGGPPQILSVTRADDHAVITFAWGTCALQATDTALVVRLEVRDVADLGQAEALIAHRIQTIGSREQLTVEWQREPPTVP
jgi:hypothetical protein